MLMMDENEDEELICWRWHDFILLDSVVQKVAIAPLHSGIWTNCYCSTIRYLVQNVVQYQL